MKKTLLLTVLAVGAAALATEPHILPHPDTPLPEGAEVERVATGFKFTEGPAWNKAAGIVFFSDIPNNRIVAFDPETNNTRDAFKPSNNSNGLMHDKHGRVVRCEHAGRRVARLEKGKWVTLADSYKGKKLNSPNDLDIDAAGGIYFTDPRYGNEDNRELDVYGVYYIAPGADKTVTQLIVDLKKPNGIALSPDGKTLYVVDNGAATLWAYDVKGPGQLANGRKIADTGKRPEGGGGDGMCVDEKGLLYVTAGRNVWVFSPKGNLISWIPCPENPANCAFGGTDNKTLYITARKSLYRIKLNNAGNR